MTREVPVTMHATALHLLLICLHVLAICVIMVLPNFSPTRGFDYVGFIILHNKCNFFIYPKKT